MKLWTVIGEGKAIGLFFTRREARKAAKLCGRAFRAVAIQKVKR